MTRLFIVSAVLESGAGVAFLVAPEMVISLVFGQSVPPLPVLGIARLTGVALLSLAAACFLARKDDGSVAASALVIAMLFYNVAVVGLVLAGVLGSLGAVQWAAVILHLVMAGWCARIAASRRR